MRIGRQGAAIFVQVIEGRTSNPRPPSGDDTNSELRFIWAAIRAVKLVEEFWRHGICADVVSIDVDGDCHYSW